MCAKKKGGIPVIQHLLQVWDLMTQSKEQRLDQDQEGCFAKSLYLLKQNRKQTNRHEHMKGKGGGGGGRVWKTREKLKKINQSTDAVKICWMKSPTSHPGRGAHATRLRALRHVWPEAAD